MPFDRHAKLALLVACATLLVCGVGFRVAVRALNIYLRKEPVALRETFATIPRTIGQWRVVGDDVVYEQAMIEELGTGSYLDRAYAIEGEPSKGLLQVHLAYYTGMIDAVPHIPDRCFVASGLEPRSLSEVHPLLVDRSDWVIDRGPANIATGEPYRLVMHADAYSGLLREARMPVGELEIRVTEFGRKDKPDLRVFGGFLFVANGRITATPEHIRMMAFMPSERSAYYCKVQFVHAAPGATIEQYLELVSDYLRDFLPELMLRLPDWQVVERAGDPAPGDVNDASSGA